MKTYLNRKRVIETQNSMEKKRVINMKETVFYYQ